jgi:citrate synthase
MSTTIRNEVNEGLEGVVAFATEIAEPDRAGGALRYRGVDVEEIVGRVPFEQVWGLLVDGALEPGLTPAATPVEPARGGDARRELQAAIARLPLRPLIDLDAEQARDELALASAATLELAAQIARDVEPVGAGGDSAVVAASGGDPAAAAARAGDTAEAAARFLARWRGDADPAHARALDAYWITAAEHGMNASTFTARVVASTGADVGAAISAAVGALSGPLHGGAPARVLQMLDDVEREGDAQRYVKRVLDRGERLMGFGHRIYRAEDPRARVLRRTAADLRAPRLETAAALERAALEELQARKPDRVLATNVEFWSAVVLDFAQIPPALFLPLFACARTAGWSAHILEQKRSGRLVRPTAVYVGEPPRSLPG